MRSAVIEWLVVGVVVIAVVMAVVWATGGFSQDVWRCDVTTTSTPTGAVVSQRCFWEDT